jgi:pyridoxamine 5'-phosphate oxidase
VVEESADAHARPLWEGDLDPDPLEAFGTWFREAVAAGLRLPEAMALATASAEGIPSVRMVLLKAFDRRGFVFYTNYESRKGRDLAENPRGTMLFYWDPLGRQVRIEGSVERISREESVAYFATRPPGSRASAAASRQSEVISSREELEAAVERMR